MNAVCAEAKQKDGKTQFPLALEAMFAQQTRPVASIIRLAMPTNRAHLLDLPTIKEFVKAASAAVSAGDAGKAGDAGGGAAERVGDGAGGVQQPGDADGSEVTDEQLDTLDVLGSALPAAPAMAWLPVLSARTASEAQLEVTASAPVVVARPGAPVALDRQQSGAALAQAAVAPWRCWLTRLLPRPLQPMHPQSAPDSSAQQQQQRPRLVQVAASQAAHKPAAKRLMALTVTVPLPLPSAQSEGQPAAARKG
jgi:hypothetical protein